jgi:hypothetical protein
VRDIHTPLRPSGAETPENSPIGAGRNERAPEESTLRPFVDRLSKIMSSLRRPIASALLILALADAARADCIDDAAAHHQVNAAVLRAIGWNESHLDPAAMGHNANGSTDIGAFQINSAHLPDLARYGVTARLLGDGCVSAYVAAWQYRRQMDRFGNTWAAIGAYHSRTPSRSAWYANRIARILMSWGALPRTALPYAEWATQGPGARDSLSPAPSKRAASRPSPEDLAPDDAPELETALFDAQATHPPAH